MRTSFFSIVMGLIAALNIGVTASEPDRKVVRYGDQNEGGSADPRLLDQMGRVRGIAGKLRVRRNRALR